MAFLQSEIPPSTAPVAPARTMRVDAAPAPARRGFFKSKLAARLLFALLVTVILAALAIAAAKATESLAIGIIAADLVFLIAVAGWSAVYSGGRR